MAVPGWLAQGPVQPATNTGSGKLFQNKPFFQQTFGEVFGNYGW
jgi:hypothetical protein